jgi:hypothetical protein
MADYKRMVSYMYQYEDGVKKKNIGYVKVEAKNGQCKLTLHMQLLGQLDSIFPTYLIQRKSDDMELIYLGDTVLKNQVMDSKLTADENNIMGTGFQLSDMGGLLIFLNDNIFFATEWDDKPIVAEEVLDALRPKPKKAPEPVMTGEPKDEPKNEPILITPKRQLEEELQIPKYKLPRGFKTVERLQRPYIAGEYGGTDKEVGAAGLQSKENEAADTQSEKEEDSSEDSDISDLENIIIDSELIDIAQADNDQDENNQEEICQEED